MKNRTLGSIFIVAGTTIGAGMLAMPLAAAGVGFSVTLVLLVSLWALMCYTALLLLEVYQHVPADTGLGTLAKRYLGRYGQWVTGFSMMFLMYALTAAYISGAGELLASSISDWTGTNISPTTGVLLFTFVAGGVVCVGTSLVDLFNRLLFSAKIIFLVAMLALLMPHIHKVNLLTLPLQQGLALSAIPVIFTSFGFHGSVPSIVSYMNGNIRKLRWVFITGSAIPLVAYIFWQLATLGSINSTTFMGLLANHAGLNGLLQALREVVASPHVELAVHLFADLALATSFLGVALGLFDYLADLFQRRTDLIRCQRQHIRNAIHHNPNHPLTQVQHNHHGVFVVIHIALAKFHAQVDDRHNHTPQVRDAFDKRRRVSDARHLIITTDFLHFQDINTVLFIPQRKHEEFLT